MWIQEGDNNTKFFHRYASYRRNLNTISEIQNDEGILVSNFKDKAEDGVSFFNSLFKEKEGCHIQAILQFRRLFPRSITEEMNETLMQEVTEEELKYTLTSFQKSKSPGSDGFPMEFFLRFYDLMKYDLLLVVQE